MSHKMTNRQVAGKLAHDGLPTTPSAQLHPPASPTRSQRALTKLSEQDHCMTRKENVESIQSFNDLVNAVKAV